MLNTRFFDEMDDFRRSFEQLFDSVSRPVQKGGRNNSEWYFTPPVETGWTDDHLNLRFIVPAVATFFAYFLFWLPGALLNWEYLRQANQVEQETGGSPAGHGALKTMMVLFTWVPIGLVAGVVGMAMLFGLAGS